MTRPTLVGLLLVRVLVIFAVLLVPARAYAQSGSEKHAARVAALMQRMTLEQKVGQLFLVFFVGQTLTPSLQRSIDDYHVGGVVLFQGNIASAGQTASLINAAQQRAISSSTGIPLFVGTDQEGGLIARMPQPGPTFPSQMALGAAGDGDLAARVAQAQAKMLRALGFNMNLAPVLDVNDNADNPIIGTRSFSSNPALVGKLGARMLETYRANGILAVAKHFPGHGNTSVDSHSALPVVKRDAQGVESIELAPFKSAVDANADAFMTAHIAFPALDKSGLPATLSPTILQEILRKRFGFGGLIVSDSMTMDAIDERFPVGQAVVMAFRAGVDVIAIGADIGATPADARRDYQALLKAIRAEPALQTRLDESVRRILMAKARYGILDWQPVDAAAADEALSADQIWSVAREAAQRSVTVTRNDAQLPLPAEARVLLVAPRERDKLGFYASEDLITPLKSCHASVDVELVGIRPGGAEIRRIAQKSGTYSHVIVATLNARFYSEQAALVRSLRRPIVAALRNPYDAKVVAGASTFVTTYSDTPVSLAALADVLCGRSQAQGALPVTLPEAAIQPAQPAGAPAPAASAIQAITATAGVSTSPGLTATPATASRVARRVTPRPAIRRPAVRRTPVPRQPAPRPIVRPLDPLPPPPP
jgi:beta-N-acetylhexosaminidase